MSYKVPYLRGSTRDRDFLPWRFAPYSILAADTDLQRSFPAGFTLEQMRLLSWRIREMKVSGTYTYDFRVYSGMGAHADGTATFTYTNALFHVKRRTAIDEGGYAGAFPAQGYEDATAEGQVIDYPAYLRQWEHTTRDVPGIGSVTGFFEVIPRTYAVGDTLLPVRGNAGFTHLRTLVNDPTMLARAVSGPGISLWPSSGAFVSNAYLFSLCLNYQPPALGHGPPQEQVFFDPVTKLFYPRIFFEASTDIYINFTSGTDWGPYRQRSTISTFQEVTGAFGSPEVGTFHLFGADIPLYLNDNPPATGYTPVPQPTNHAIDLTMEANKYWKYKNAAGEDVFDEDSGAQIHDP